MTAPDVLSLVAWCFALLLILRSGGPTDRGHRLGVVAGLQDGSVRDG